MSGQWDRTECRHLLSHEHRLGGLHTKEKSGRRGTEGMVVGGGCYRREREKLIKRRWEWGIRTGMRSVDETGVYYVLQNYMIHVPSFAFNFNGRYLKEKKRRENSPPSHSSCRSSDKRITVVFSPSPNPFLVNSLISKVAYVPQTRKLPQRRPGPYIK